MDATFANKEVHIAKGKSRRRKTKRPVSRDESNQVFTEKNEPSHSSNCGPPEVDVPINFDVLLKSIGDIVSKSIQQESSQINSMIKSLHYRTRTNMINHMFDLKDELLDEIDSVKQHYDESLFQRALKTLAKVVEDLELEKDKNLTLKLNCEELQKKVEELELEKQENLTLKLNCERLQKKVEELELEKQENLTLKLNCERLQKEVEELELEKQKNLTLNLNSEDSLKQ